MIYENFLIKDKAQAEILLASANNEDIKKTIIGAINGIDDWKWLQDLCLNYVYSEDFWLAKTAIIGISDIARIHKNIDLKEVLKSFNLIKDEKLQSTIAMVLEDINVFIKVK